MNLPDSLRSWFVYSASGLKKLFLLFTAMGLLEFWYRYLDFRARARVVDWRVPFIEQMTGFYAGLLLLVVLVAPVVWRVRPDQRSWTYWLPRHLAVLLLFSLVHTSLLWGSRALVFPLLGLGPYDYGIMPVRYAMEFPTDVLFYGIITAASVAVWRADEGRARELQLAQLQTELAQAQLENLSLQLQPHFLFNALNAVAAAVYEDPRKADIMIGRLADYLRRTLKSSTAQQVPLAQELEMLDLYVSVMKARFEDDLQMQVSVGEDTKGALVPQLILQPIVENAIQHGFDPQSAKVSVEVSVVRSDGNLVLAVRDHGRGLGPSAQPRVGLANTRNRLQHLHGAGACFRIANAPGGGTCVEIRLPFQIADRIA